METAPVRFLYKTARSAPAVLMADPLARRCVTPTEDETPVLDWSTCLVKNSTLPVHSVTAGRGRSSVQRLWSAVEEENEESLFLVECDDEYISEGAGIQNSDVKLEEENVLAESERMIKHLKKVNTELQKALDLSEDCNSALRAENAALKNQLKNVKQLTQENRDLKDELDAVRAAKLEQEQIHSALEAREKQFDKKYEALKDQKEAVDNALSSAQDEKEMYKKKSEELGQLVIALQQELVECRHHLAQAEELIQEKDLYMTQLKDTISEYRTIKQDMKEKIQDLEGQLALALVSGRGCNFMNVDNTLPADRQSPASLGEELGFLHAGQMECTSEEEEKEEESDKEDHSVQEERGETTENKDDTKLEVKHIEETESVEEEACSSRCPVSWLTKTYENVKTGVRNAGFLGVSLLVPLVLLRALLPVLCDWLGLNGADFFWILARLIEPHLSVHYTGLPPV